MLLMDPPWPSRELSLPAGVLPDHSIKQPAATSEDCRPSVLIDVLADSQNAEVSGT